MSVASPIVELGLDAAFIGRLDRLVLISKARLRGLGTGARRSLSTGNSVEFADYRTYAPGDDLRRVDWNAYARLERIFLRIFEAEENTTLTLFLDCSTSMAGGEPAKSRLARQVAAALGYIALASYDRVAVVAVQGRLSSYLPPRSGRVAAPEVWRFLAALPDEGSTALDSLRAFEGISRRPGIAVLLTDMLTDSDWRSGLQALRLACRQEVTVLQILAPQELRPDIDGDLTLIDAETQDRMEISAGPTLLRRYHNLLAAYTEEIAGWCRSQSIAFAQVSSATPIDALMLHLLRRIGVAR